MTTVETPTAQERLQHILEHSRKIYRNLRPEMLIRHAVRHNEGVMADNGALVIRTGKFTGRTPEDRYIVRDELTENKVNWGKVNFAVTSTVFDNLFAKMQAYLENKELFVREAYACASAAYRMSLRVITTNAFNNLFAYNMFLRPEEEELICFDPEFTVLCVPQFEADPEVDGVKHKNFVILDLTKKVVLIGGTGYTGEIKKSVFSALNFLLPQKGVMPMHCSANVGKEGDTAIFFGLSGTGKTTLSADPERYLIGDDEHGWDDTSVFNFEGGCYAKVIDLTAEKEPDIWKAIRLGALVENVVFKPGTREIDYTDKTITENTRVSYPIDHIDLVAKGLQGNSPKNIFFLSCDAFGVLPPISKLTPQQAMYYFLSGYTAKIAGTEAGITEPKAAFSSCFGAPFLPLHPTEYAHMLGSKLKQENANVWLINTGWVGGNYHTGSRIKLSYTRSLITAALNGSLQDVAYTSHPVFGLEMPNECPNVPTELLNPINSWADKNAYNAQADQLADMFTKNFGQFEAAAGEEVLQGGPVTAKA
jgi:phosphoenolpyruvate carboxykinase (ATP)